MRQGKLVGATGFEPATPCAQGRCATRLRYAPTSNALDFTAFSNGILIALVPFRDKPVAELLSIIPSVPERQTRWRVRCIFSNASRFICSFICEYFLNTLASPCRRNCVTHSSATPSALRRAAPPRLGPQPSSLLLAGH